MKKILILAMLFLLISITLSGQTEEILFHDINYKNGLLPNQGAGQILQDHKGYIWIAKQYYLQRYDGYEFKTYNVSGIESDKLEERSGTGVNDMIEDQRGILWMSSGNGIKLLNPENDLFILIPDSILPISNTILEDKKGIIWCGTDVELIKIKLNNNAAEQVKSLIFKTRLDSVFKISKYEIPGIDRSMINVIFEDSQERLWIGSSFGLHYFDKKNETFIRIDHKGNGESRLVSPYIATIAEESPDVLWVRSSQGISRISNINLDSTIITEQAVDFDIKNYQDDRIISYNKNLFIDSHNNIWLGTQNSGLIKISIDEELNATFEEVYHDLYEAEGAEFSQVAYIMEDRTGLLWTGHLYPKIRMFRERNNPFFRMEGLLGSEYAQLFHDYNQIYEDEDENLWICTWGSGLLKLSKDGEISEYTVGDGATSKLRASNSLTSLLELDKGIFLVGAGNGFYELNTHTGISQLLIPYGLPCLIYAMYRIGNEILISGCAISSYNLITKETKRYFRLLDVNGWQRFGHLNSFKKTGIIWFYNDSLGICKAYVDPVENEPVIINLPDSVLTNIQNYLGGNMESEVINQDSRGYLWLNIPRQNIIIELNTKTGAIRTWKDYSNMNLMAFQEDNNGNLWFAFKQGLYMVDPKSGILKIFDKDDGLPDSYHTQFSTIDRKGRLYFSGTGSIYRVNPENIHLNKVIPPIVITGFKLFNKPVTIDSSRRSILRKHIAYTQEISLRYNQNDLSFTFASLDYNDPSKNMYAYILENYQDEWIYTDADNRIATYTNLKPDKYVFKVRGSNNDGVWNEEGTYINITIHPPPWKTVWAYIVYGICILLLLRGYIFWRTQRLRKEKIVLEKQVSERTAELKTANTQLREHEQELQEVNTLLEEQKEELMQQKEELESTLENLQKTQEQLIESEKMAAVGGLVAGVAHEINTPVGIGITAISNLKDDIQRMSKLYEKDEISREDFKKFLQASQDVANLIEKNLERTASLVQSFKQVSTDQVTEQQRVFAFKEYLEDILISLRPKFSNKNIDFKVECDDKLKLNSYPGVYAQIFTNLLLNSLQHGFYERDKGTITIKAEMDEKLLKIHYSDDGSGISKKDLPHIFEPFYTSDQHRGTGLGLNIIYNLVKQKLHGTIACESEQGKGALFRIEVPVK